MTVLLEYIVNMCVNFVIAPFMYEYLVKFFYCIGIVLNAPVGVDHMYSRYSCMLTCL